MDYVVHSIAVSPHLTCETWFMEGTLIPDYHYIEIKEDFSDLKEKLQYYIDHPEKANAIIQHDTRHSVININMVSLFLISFSKIDYAKVRI